MNTELPEFLANTDPTWLAGVGLLVAAALVVFIWVIYKLRHPSDQARVEKIIKEISDAYIKDAVLSDGLYGYHFIDYLILLPGKILVLAVQDNEGYIFGGEKIEKWAQVVNNRSFNFDNPLINTHHYIQAVRTICNDVDIVNRVVFTSKSSFPKGIPAGVIELKNLKKELEALKGADSATNPVKSMWDKLLESSKQQKVQYKQELSTAA
ncbi:nuclease-related domain-containing protein [Kaarinaea lacus]